ncbi:MAG: hypothetical protein QXV96_01085 [Candidatus Bathyarchaeia archaeon]
MIFAVNRTWLRHGFYFSIPLLIILLPFMGVFLKAAVVGCAGIRLEGGDPKIKD